MYLHVHPLHFSFTGSQRSQEKVKRCFTGQGIMQFLVHVYHFFFGGNLSSDFAGKKLFMFISFSCKRCLYSPCNVMRVRLLPCDHHSRVTCWWDAFVLAVKICQLCHQRTLSPSSRKNQKELNKWVAAM